MYFPWNGIIPLKSHRCPGALIRRLPQVSFYNMLGTWAKEFITMGREWYFVPGFPCWHQWSWNCLMKMKLKIISIKIAKVSLYNICILLGKIAWIFVFKFKLNLRFQCMSSIGFICNSHHLWWESERSSSDVVQQNGTEQLKQIVQTTLL